MKRFIALLLVVLTLVSVVPAAVFAAEAPIIPETGMPFKDVKTSHWFYNAVKYTYDKGIFSANNSAGDLFTPNTTMTRAMFVTVLFRLSGVDQSAYTGKTSFTDVPVDQWYAKAVQWANEKGYVAGMTETTFAPNGNITRSQMARILSLYAAGEDNYDLTDVRESAYEKFADADKVQSWAKEGITWMSTTGLINGMGTENGGPVLNPNGNATRAQAAQILMSYSELRYGKETAIGEVYIGENSLEDYTIVYGTTGTNNNNFSGAEIAGQLHDYILKATGLDLPVKADTVARDNEEDDREILIGRTNREDNGLVNIDRSGFDIDTDTFTIQVQGNYLIFASNERHAGTYNAVYEFCETYLGYNFLVTLEVITPKNVVEIPADLNYTEGTPMLYRMSYNNKYSQSKQLRNQESFYSWANVVHTLPEFGTDPSKYNTSWGYHLQYYMAKDPCLTRPDIQQNMITNVVTLLKSKPQNNLVWVCQSDAEYYCNGRTAEEIKNGCTCAEFYQTNGRCSTYLNILDVVADGVYEASKEEGYEYLADYYIVGLAYKYTWIAPKSTEGWDMNEKVVMCICTDNACSAHALTDPNCKNYSNDNVDYMKVYNTFAEICPNLFVWDYINGDYYSDSPFPIIHQMYENFQLYHETGVWGTYVLGDSSLNASFAELKTYLVSKLQWEADMTEDEYWNYVDTFLEGFYGDGWSYIREYIEVTHDLSSENEWHIWSKNRWDYVITYEQYLENFDYLMGLWEKAEELAYTDEQKLNVRRGAVQMKYIEVCMAYEKYRISGDAADLEAFKTVNIAYGEYLDTLGNCQYKLPWNWREDTDPNLWKNDYKDCWSGDDSVQGAVCPCRTVDENGKLSGCTCEG